MPERERRSESRRAKSGPAVIIAGVIFFALSLLTLTWLTVNLHPDAGAAAETSAKKQLDLMSGFDAFVNNFSSEALGDLVYIKKIYTIPEGDVAGPVPDPAKFGATDDPAVVRAVVDAASELLDGRELSWNEDIVILPNTKIHYYSDETILAISWLESIEEKACTCAEIVVADGSQLRRKIAGDSYGSSIRLTATDMAKQANAVFAINGDFYTFRSLGVTVYQRELYRFEPETVDSCFFTASGDMLFSRAGELKTEEEARQFISDNDVTFSVSFGPVLIDGGEIQPIGAYPIGENFRAYSRASIGMIEELHYFTLNINFAVNFFTTATTDYSARILRDKGCVKAYALDGGQTSVAIMNGELMNHVDYGSERTMSDIIYFATALPGTEVHE